MLKPDNHAVTCCYNMFNICSSVSAESTPKPLTQWIIQFGLINCNLSGALPGINELNH